MRYIKISGDMGWANKILKARTLVGEKREKMAGYLVSYEHSCDTKLLNQSIEKNNDS